MDNIYKLLFDRNLISERQFEFLEAIRSRKIVSLYFELRLVLYLGIVLFSGGVGYFAYQNMGSLGHVLSMVLIAAAVVAGFYYIQKYAKPYSPFRVVVDHHFFDYILIFTALLLITLLVYFQVYFDLVRVLFDSTTFISATILFFMAYRFDSLSLLAMGITALAGALGISLSPLDILQREALANIELYLMGVMLGFALVAVGQLSKYKEIKGHFKFTYQNFGLLIFFISCISALIFSDSSIFYASLMLITSLFLLVYTWVHKEFLFFLYSNIAGYIAFTYLLFQIVDSLTDSFLFFIYYFPASCILYIFFLVNKKSHFAHD